MSPDQNGIMRAMKVTLETLVTVTTPTTLTTLYDNNYYDLHVIIRGVNKQNLGVYKSFISLRPKAEVK